MRLSGDALSPVIWKGDVLPAMHNSDNYMLWVRAIAYKYLKLFLKHSWAMQSTASRCIGQMRAMSIYGVFSLHAVVLKKDCNNTE